MTRKDSEKTFARSAREALEAVSEGLDDDTRRRLQRIRKEALEIAPRQRRRRPLRSGAGWLAGAAAMAALAAAIYFNAGPAPVDTASQNAVENFDIMAFEEPLDLIDDIEFYAWLAEAGDGDV